MAEERNGNGKNPFSWFMYANNPPVPSTTANFEAYELYFLQGLRPSPRYRTWLQSVEQGSDEWKEEKKKYASASNNAAYTGLNPFQVQFDVLRAHIWTPPPENPTMVNPYADVFKNFSQFIMDRGSLLEDGARQIYDHLRLRGRLFQTVEEAASMQLTEKGMALHDEHPYMSASPDLLIGLLGAGEIKCPYSKKDLRVVKVHYYVPVYYMTQMQTVMAIFKREWCDFISYGRLLASSGSTSPLRSAITVIRVYFNRQYWEALQARVKTFIETVLRLRKAGVYDLPPNTMFVVQGLRSTIANSASFSEADIVHAMETAASKVWVHGDRREMGPLMRALCDSGITDRKFNEAAYNPQFAAPLNADGTVNMLDPRVSDPGGVEYEQSAPHQLGEHIRIRTRTIIVPNIDDIPLSDTDASQGHYGDFVEPLLENPDLSKLQFYKLAHK